MRMFCFYRGDMDINKKTKGKDSIPLHFDSAEKAGEFWDTHSAVDYWNEMEETEVEFDIQKHTFLVPIDEQIYKLVRKQAETKHCPVGQIINKLLNREIVKAR